MELIYHSLAPSRPLLGDSIIENTLCILFQSDTYLVSTLLHSNIPCTL
jgi:hypothetical protein